MWTAAVPAAAAAGFLAWAVRGRSSQILAPSVWRAPAGRRRIALTFDDGPSESTPRLLELLHRHNAKATFFVCGHNAARLPRVLQQISAAGHEIGNHTWSHPRFDFASKSTMLEELTRTQDLIASLTGSPPRLFRAPYGVRWFGLGAVQNQLGLQGVMWSVIGRDWALPAPSITRRILSNTRDGSILCLHDARVLSPNPDISQTLLATAQFLPILQQRDLSITSVSAILES
jgi:peptidoglycan/xylan/chitin deacetylase (PgdA/CDA1 family)